MRSQESARFPIECPNKAQLPSSKKRKSRWNAGLRMARPGLEPGTPRFSGRHREASNCAHVHVFWRISEVEARLDKSANTGLSSGVQALRRASVPNGRCFGAQWPDGRGRLELGSASPFLHSGPVNTEPGAARLDPDATEDDQRGPPYPRTGGMRVELLYFEGCPGVEALLPRLASVDRGCELPSRGPLNTRRRVVRGRPISCGFSGRLRFASTARTSSRGRLTGGTTG